MNEVADRLDPRPPGGEVAELLPGKIGEQVGVAVAAAQQVDQGLLRQQFDRALPRIQRNRIRQRRNPGSGHLRTGGSGPAGAMMRVHQLPKPSRYIDIGTPGSECSTSGLLQIRGARIMHVQIQDHRRRLDALVDQFVADSYLHGPRLPCRGLRCSRMRFGGEASEIFHARGARLMNSSRMEAFSDGVIAIIITIMVLELKVPHGADLAALQPDDSAVPGLRAELHLRRHLLEQPSSPAAYLQAGERLNPVGQPESAVLAVDVSDRDGLGRARITPPACPPLCTAWC